MRYLSTYISSFLCWFGIHRGWYLERQYMDDARVFHIMGVDVFEDCIHFIDYCPSCHRRWRSLLAPNGKSRHFTQPETREET